MMMPRTIRQYRNKSIDAILPLFYKLSSLILPRFVCQITGDSYRTKPIGYWNVAGKRFVQVRCGCCDARGVGHNDPMYDKTYPHIHIYEL